MIVVPLARPEASPLPPPSTSSLASDAASTSTRARSTRQRKPRHPGGISAGDDGERSRASSSSLSSAGTPSPGSTPDPVALLNSTYSSSVHRDLARVWEAVSSSRRIVIVTGAGISVSKPANIPDFRSSTGLFRTLKEQHPNAGLSSGKDLFDARLFQSEANTALFYSMIAQLHSMTLAAHPTLFHHFLKRLDEQGRLQRVYTQNIDALEDKVGLTFGLGQGKGKAFQRTASLGKRKRLAAAAAAAAAPTDAGAEAPTTGSASSDTDRSPARKRSGWSKTQSAPAVSLAAALQPEEGPPSAMFPRVIPLHGSLAHLVCTACDFKHATLPTPSEEVKAALNELSAGETPSCPACSERDSVRLAAGLRSRGIGFLKPDVVLYNGDNKSGERVGECLERDVLGLRDRLDGRVPETFAEERVRVKREEKEKAKEAQVKPEPQTRDHMGSAQADSVVGSSGGAAEDVLGRVFEEDEEEETSEVSQQLGAPSETVTSSSGSQPSPTARLLQGVRARKSMQRATTQPATLSSNLSGPIKKSPSTKPLKPLPPDLLIVAGTSLKVPGTKRVVREFAKAARARDGIIPKGCASQRRSKTPSSRSRSASWESASASDADGGDEEGDEDEDDDDYGVEDGTDPSRPIRTILLNYDFPVPSKEWEDVFDVWIQGDVQTAAGGLWSASKGYGLGSPLEPVNMDSCEGSDDIAGVRSWETSLDTLKAEREQLKKADRAERARAKKEQQDGEDSQDVTPTEEKKPGMKRTASMSSKAKGSEREPQVRGVTPVVVIPTSEMTLSEDDETQAASKGTRRRASSSSTVGKGSAAGSRRSSASSGTKSLGPSKKLNSAAVKAANGGAGTTGGGGGGGVDKMFPPAKRSASTASHKAGPKQKAVSSKGS
ncbi:unnamed protein product [Jaminaea pallidilutea]